MTAEQREELARDAEAKGLRDIASAVRLYLSIEPITDADVQRTKELFQEIKNDLGLLEVIRRR